MDKKPTYKYLLYLLLVLICIVLIKSAWLSDDAYITFRTVDNFINGHGLRWNIVERVQSFTHPLWMLLISFIYLLTGEIYYTVIILSVAISVLSVWLIGTRLITDSRSILMIFAVLLSSRAFVDYSISGLENPLSHLLMIIFAIGFFNKPMNLRNLTFLTFIVSLAVLNRPDTILLYCSPLIYTAYQPKRNNGFGIGQILKSYTIGFSPLITWGFFSLLYYGFLLPNTFYSKLNTGIKLKNLLQQGMLYFFDSINQDTITLLVVIFAIILGFKSKEGKKITLVLSIVFYLLYIIRIGGDFMSGRFFSLPLLLAVIIYAKSEFKEPMIFIFPVIFILIGLTVKSPPVFYSAKDRVVKIKKSGICDERGYYYQHTGLLTRTRNTSTVNHLQQKAGLKAKGEQKSIYIKFQIGFFGFYAGPDKYIVDSIGLANPFLSKLPIKDPIKWRIGHFRRKLPVGYIETLKTKINCIEDPNLRQLYEIIKEITQGKIFSLKRFLTIIKFNLGFYKHLYNDVI